MQKMPGSALSCCVYTLERAPRTCITITVHGATEHGVPANRSKLDTDYHRTFNCVAMFGSGREMGFELLQPLLQELGLSCGQSWRYRTGRGRLATCSSVARLMGKPSQAVGCKYFVWQICIP